MPRVEDHPAGAGATADWQNGYAGNDLQSWYTGDRILHKDLFYVNVLQP
ncbi:hypothetical protein ACFC4G_46510 [Streptomyces sp. NPDC056002]